MTIKRPMCYIAHMINNVNLRQKSVTVVFMKTNIIQNQEARGPFCSPDQ